ncbi:MAG: response regulator [Chloroflexota bacterium]|nr:MAG: response regulator [Chloroflexota bacterium]
MNDTRIMIVEDERIVAKDLQFRLQGLGYEVAAMASEGHDAVAKASSSRPNLVLMDIRLENGMDGIQAAEQIRNELDIPVVFLTAYADQATLARAKITEPFGYILKPFEERELQSTIEIALYRHKAEQKLRDSERRYRSLVDNSQGLIWTHDLDGKILSINPAAAHLLGYEPREVVGHNLSEFMPTEFHATLEDYLARVQEQENDSGSLQVLTRAGDTRILQYRNVWHDEPGRPPYILAHAADVTDRMRVEQVLRDQNAYLTALHETTLGLMSRLELEDLLEQIITRAAALVGTEHGYVFLLSPQRDIADEQEMVMRVGIGAYNGFKGTKANRGVGLAGTVWQTGEPLVVDDYRNWSGRLALSSRDILRAVAGVPLKSGTQTVGVIGLAYLEEGRRFDKDEMQALTRFAELAAIALDNARLYQATQSELGERKRAEEQLRSAENFLNTVVNNIPHMIFVKDAQDLRFVRFNQAGEELVGMTTGAMLGKSDYDLFPEEEAAFFEKKDRETLASGKMLDISEEPLDTPSGRRYLHTKKIPVLDTDGQPKYLLGISEDITEHKLEQERQRALERKLQETQKLESLGVLAGGIAHDFNNLLVSILGNVGLVLVDLESDSPVREPVEQIKVAAQRAADLTRQMLAYSGKGRFVMQRINLNSVITEITQLLQVSINKNAQLRFDLMPNLPPIEGDVTQVRQVLMNLIVNASDAIGERAGTIGLTTGIVQADHEYLSNSFMAPDLPEGHYAFVEVTDNGQGMDKETQAKIFDPFFTTKFTGRGLGLAAVLGIVRGHGGTIKVYSEIGQGSVFRVLFPIKDAPHDTEKPTTEILKQKGNGTVLVIDDEEVVRNVTKRMLSRLGYTPLVAEDGPVGLAVYEKHKDQIVCILLDMTMPRMSGEETLVHLKKVNPDVRVLLMSGYSEQEASNRFNGKGVGAFMQKPYTPQDLQEKLDEILEN